MKLNQRTFLFQVLILASVAGMTIASSFADDYTVGGRDRAHRERRGGFEMGVCVGQTLASQGITLPPPVEGERYLSGTDQQTIQSAVESCREEFQATASPTPTPAPSAPASTAPTGTAPSSAPSMSPPIAPISSGTGTAPAAP